jgi:mannonate dehydratase
MPILTRRRLLLLSGLGLAAVPAARYALPSALRRGDPKPPTGAAAELVERCFADLDRAAVWDVHCHVLGLGRGSGCYVNPELRSHLNVVKRFQYDLYMAAAGFSDAPEVVDADYTDRLFALHRAMNPAGKLVLMAFDHVVDEDGEERFEKSNFHTPNDYVLRLARENDDMVACGSIHPYRKDAADRLRALAAAGGRAIKWLPAAMQIDPASPRCDAFYAAMAETGLPLFSHAGAEAAVDASHAADFGNPLRLRRALDAGVRVVVPHCAGLGDGEDLEAPKDASGHHPKVSSFDLFLRLMDDARYTGHLFADISAMTQFNRCEDPLQRTLDRQDLHPRLVNGTDYPLPAIDPLVSTRRLVQLGYLTSEERALCNEIFEANPLTFDLVVKRLLTSAQGNRFQSRVFETRWVYEPRSGPEADGEGGLRPVVEGQPEGAVDQLRPDEALPRDEDVRDPEGGRRAEDQ